MLIDSGAKFRKPSFSKVTDFIACVSCVDHFCARRKARGEFGNNFFNEFAVRSVGLLPSVRLSVASTELESRGEKQE